MSALNDAFLTEAWHAAVTAKHVFPDYAACEAALESAWGQARLAVEANNLFGQKQSHPPLTGTGTLEMPTREFLHGLWVTVSANWAIFPNWEACFVARMALLRDLAGSYTAYAQALGATTGTEFIQDVSKSWSTDPDRAGKVLSIYDAHKSVFEASE